MSDYIVGLFGIVLWAGYVFGPVLGLYAAVTSGSFFHALGSIIVPWYGVIYWMVS